MDVGGGEADIARAVGERHAGRADTVAARTDHRGAAGDLLIAGRGARVERGAVDDDALARGVLVNRVIAESVDGRYAVDIDARSAGREDVIVADVQVERTRRADHVDRVP